MIGLIFDWLKSDVLPTWFFEFGTISYLILLSPLLFKDLLFRNASLGKKIMGIAIYNEKWEAPRVMLLVKRTALMLTVGNSLLYKAYLVDGNKLKLFDWERETFNTRVVDKKVLREIKENAEKMGGDVCENMTKLYNEYILGVYGK